MAETILGKVCPTPKGVYNATAKYEKLDIIQHDGNGYMVLKECTGVLPSEGEYYMLLPPGAVTVPMVPMVLPGPTARVLIRRRWKPGILALRLSSLL